MQPAFHQFSRLPPELRDEIWRLCLPHRISEFWTPNPKYVWLRYSFESDKEEPLWPCSIESTARINALPPTIAQVCHESRQVALENGTFKAFQGRQSGDWTGWKWEDLSRNSHHLNFTQRCVASFAPEMDAMVPPLERMAMWMERSAGHGGSIMWEYLDPIFSGAMGLASDQTELLNVLRRHPKWLVVVHTVVVHDNAGKASASGLFGLLGDAPVQVVDVAEEDRLEALMSMAEDVEHNFCMSPAQTFVRRSVKHHEQQLSDMLKERFNTDQFDFVFRPAIMFRLCTRMCNHLPGDT